MFKCKVRNFENLHYLLSFVVVLPTSYFSLCRHSHYHPESWSAKWTVRTLIESLRLHMLTTATEIGGIEATRAKRESLARASRHWASSIHPTIHVDHSAMVKNGLFPAIDEEEEEKLEDLGLTLPSDDEDEKECEYVDVNLQSDKEEDLRVESGDQNYMNMLPVKPQQPSLLILLQSPLTLKVLFLGLCIVFVILNTS